MKSLTVISMFDHTE